MRRIHDGFFQDPPDLLPKMYALLQSGEYDMVATRRINRKGEPIIRSFFAKCFYGIFNRLADIHLASGARDYRMMTRKVVDVVLSVNEYNRFSKGLYEWVGFKTKYLEYQNSLRLDGRTKWGFSKLWRYAIDGIIDFSEKPLAIVSWFGIFMTFFSFFMGLLVIVKKLVFGDPVSGWSSLVCIIIFIGGIQLFCIGIVGRYLAKVYLEVKRRPMYVVCDTNMDGPSADGYE